MLGGGMEIDRENEMTGITSDEQAAFDDLRYPLAIIGAGALGLTLAARLGKVERVAVVARNPQHAETLRAGVAVGGEWIRFDAFSAEAPPRADWVIVLVKAGDTEAAAHTACAMQPLGVVSLQNGLIEDRLRAACTGVAAAQGMTTVGAYREDGRVTPAGDGETLLPPGFEAVAEQLRHAGIAARVVPDIRAARLAKLLVNLALNPVSAIFRVPNGALLDLPCRLYVEALVREAWPVLRAEGLALDADAAMAKVMAVLAATGANRSSMLQDVLAGRRTELDALTGAFLQLAAQHGAEVPTHEAVLRLLRTC
jgi:2-dehydropantoate 2-reductase